jgi:hypothetical protein
MTFFYGDPSFPTRFGQDVAGAGDPTDLFLRIFGGEVMEAFYAATIMRDKHYKRQIPNGKSASFPRVWKLSSEYHTAGVEMLGQTTSQTEKVITLDGLLVSHFALYDLDEAMTHFDVRSVYAEACGKALAETFDTNVMRQVVLGARETMTAPFPSGKRIKTSDVTTLAGGFDGASLTAGAINPAGFIGAARAARLYLRSLNVPDSLPFYAVVTPTVLDMLKWARLSNAAGANYYGDLIFQHGDYAKQGSVAGVAESVTIEGITFYASNLLPGTDQTVDETVYSKYRADYSTCQGIIWSPMGVGTLELLGMTMEIERDVRRKETFIVASMAVGHGTLRNELLLEITNLAS